MTHRTCDSCHTALESAYPIRKYCSLECRERAKWLRTQRIPCDICGGPTGYKVGQADKPTHNACRKAQWGHGTHKGYNTNACRCDECTRWNRETHAEYLRKRALGQYPIKECSSDGCDRPTQGRGLCRLHYKRWARANGMDNPPSAAWSDVRRNHRHARRARMNGQASNSRALLSEIVERDGTACASCGEPVQLDLAYPDPMSKSVDHTTPLSRGGAHTLDNVTLMHLVCNLRKGAKVEAESVMSTQGGDPLSA